MSMQILSRSIYLGTGTQPFFGKGTKNKMFSLCAWAHIIAVFPPHIFRSSEHLFLHITLKGITFVESQQLKYYHLL